MDYHLWSFKAFKPKYQVHGYIHVIFSYKVMIFGTNRGPTMPNKIAKGRFHNFVIKVNKSFFKCQKWFFCEASTQNKIENWTFAIFTWNGPYWRPTGEIFWVFELFCYIPLIKWISGHLPKVIQNWTTSVL